MHLNISQKVSKKNIPCSNFEAALLMGFIQSLEEICNAKNLNQSGLL